jgi:4-amino-4-deoxy-L-arabinose transferase-like glycosyltransferase
VAQASGLCCTGWKPVPLILLMTENRKPRTENAPAARWESLYLAALALAGAALFFWRLGAAGLMDPDEGRYAEIAREFFVSSDWLIPHLNLLPYLEKPPLVYWLTALSFGVLGPSELAARLPAALSALAGLFLAYGLGRALWGPAAAWAGALVLATSAGYLALGRLLTLDMTFALFLNLGVGLGFLALRRPRPFLWFWAYGALALAVLTKGPVAVVLAGLIWGAWALFSRQPLASLIQPRAWLLLAAVSLPWFARVQWQFPDFFQFFILEQHLRRYLSPAMHPKPFYYYLPVLLGLMLPWSWLLPWSLGRRETAADPERLFLLLWAGVILAFFSLSRGKLPSYILPALLPLALLLGRTLNLRGRGGRGLVVSLAVWALVGWTLLGLYWWTPAFLAPNLAPADLLKPYLAWGLAGLALIPTVALIWRHPAVLLVGALLFSTLVPPGMERVSLGHSPREAGRTLKSHWQPGAALVGVKHYSPGLSFYGGQVFHFLDLKSELDFGRQLSPESQLFFPGSAEMTAFVRSRPRVFFFLKAQALPGLEQELPGHYLTLARYKDCLLVAYGGK